MANKFTYIVRGSEDGNLGVFTTKKRAVACATNYVQQAGVNPQTEKCGDWHTEVSTETGHSTASVEKFNLNWDCMA